MNKKEWLNYLKKLWEKERKSIDNIESPLDRTWHYGYQAALEDIYIEMENENATL